MTIRPDTFNHSAFSSFFDGSLWTFNGLVRAMLLGYIFMVGMTMG